MPQAVTVLVRKLMAEDSFFFAVVLLSHPLFFNFMLSLLVQAESVKK